MSALVHEFPCPGVPPRFALGVQFWPEALPSTGLFSSMEFPKPFAGENQPQPEEPL